MAAVQENLYYRLHNLTMSGGLDQQRPSSALARGVQITEFKDARLNPEPIVLEDSEILMEQYLSPGKLKILTGVQNLEAVTSLELKVDTSDTSLGNFGSLLPNLTQLKLSNSLIACIRDLGSSLRGLHVLWMSRCGLTELDGMSSMSSLKELYLSYNEISDLSPLSMLDTLQIVDLEGNNLENISQVEYLSMCHRLKSLTLEGNPLCVQPSPNDESDDYDYRLEIRKIIPTLVNLDDEILTDQPSPTKKMNAFDKDWAYLQELTSDMALSTSTDSLQSSGGEINSRPTSGAVRPSTGFRPGSALRPSSGFRPLTAGRRPATVSVTARPSTARPTTAGPKTEGGQQTGDASSDLTLGKVICGNPSKALLGRRKVPIQQEKEVTVPKAFPEFKHTPEHTYDNMDDGRDRSEIQKELREWKMEHEKRMTQIRESKEAAQVLVVNHDDAISLSSDEEDVDTEEEDNVEISALEGGAVGGSAALKEEISRAYMDLQYDEDPTVSAFKLGRRHMSHHHDETTEDSDVSSPRQQERSPLSYERPPMRPLTRHSPIPSIPTEVKVPTPPHSAGRRRSLDRSQVQTEAAVAQPVIRGAIDNSLANRPSTARAVLQQSLPSQQRMRRQLPSVPSLPSRPHVPK